MATARLGLPRARRLQRHAEFAAVTNGGRRLCDPLFCVYALANGTAGPRLGVAVSRRAAARAVVRNLIKRQIRESFRRRQARLSGLDIVVIARPHAGRSEQKARAQSLEQLWDSVERKCRPS